MAGVACLGKAADADEWCDSGLGSLGPDAAAPGGPGLGAELGPGLSWAPLVFGYVTEDGDTALHLAVIHQHEPFLDFLLGFSAGTEYMDLQNDLGQTALHLAAILGEASTVEKLYAAGAGLCVAERRGHTALHLACRVGAHACARALLQPRPRRPREAPDTSLAQGPDHTPDANHTPVALYPDSDLEKEEEESEEDWKLQLEAENYEDPRIFTHGLQASNNLGTSTCQQAQAIRDRTQDEYDDIVVHSGRSQTRLPPTPASKPLPDDPGPV
ncbi:PREDICTED: NF-kappa-B inhibitor beta [Colobus angolensis palliatus]|uniref:NF-kappa-B inhibitor beta n=1 Tax=Colobus angolensis palliatus TaxID=336983 RepID=UPI0005F4446E|nr:PREDICTED: NF-kappa-B inhibitor beta [Colobus angolensis palliatus]